MKLTEVKKLARFAKKIGATMLQVEGLTIQFPQVNKVFIPKSSAKPLSPEDAIKALSGEGAMPSDEDLLFMSAPGPLPSEVRKAQAEAALNGTQLEQLLPKKSLTEHGNWL